MCLVVQFFGTQCTTSEKTQNLLEFEVPPGDTGNLLELVFQDIFSYVDGMTARVSTPVIKCSCIPVTGKLHLPQLNLEIALHQWLALVVVL